jgi:HEPN domain-containing protein
MQNWLIKAFNDYKSAKMLLSFPEDEMVTDTICFHLEQFVEKILKAYLISQDEDFKKVHSLEYLVKQCTDIDVEFDWLNEVAEKLADYAVEVRYPDDFYMPTVDEAKESFKLVDRVKEFISQKMDLVEFNK